MQRGLKKFAIMDVAGRLLLQCGLIPHEGPDWTEVVTFAIDNSIENLPVNYANLAEFAVNTLRETIVPKIDREIVFIDEAHSKGRINTGFHEPKAYYSDVSDLIYITAEVADEWSGGSVGKNALFAELERNGYLKRSGPKTRTHKKIPSGAAISHYRIKKTAFIDAEIVDQPNPVQPDKGNC